MLLTIILRCERWVRLSSFVAPKKYEDTHLLSMLLALSDQDTVSQNTRQSKPRFSGLVIHVVARDNVV